LLYTLDMGPIEQSLARQAKLLGQPIPERILNAPVLEANLEMFFAAFFELDTDRPQGMMGIGRIPWAAIQHYGVANHYDAEQLDDLHRFIRAMDNAHLERLESKKVTTK
jgi:hypothetical protein